MGTLTGKDNKNARKKSKAISAAKNDPKYIDATKVCKGLEPKNGNFIKSKTEAPKKVEKKEEPKEAPKEEPKKEEQENRERRYQQGRTTGVGGLEEQDHCKEGRAQSRRYEWRAAKQGP